MKRALCPGSYDPVTVGHLNVIRRAAALFDEVVVLVSINSAKKPLFTAAQRVELLQHSVRGLGNVRVQAQEGLLAEIARQEDASVLVKGVRSAADLEYEQRLAEVNRHLNPQLETVLLPAEPATAWISSTVVREMLRYHQDISGMVPDGVPELISLQQHKEEERHED